MVEQRSRKERIEAKTRRLKAKLRQEILTPSHLALIAMPILVLAWLIGSISSLSRNWNLQQEINERQRQYKYLELQVENIKLENDYYSSEEYQELTARRMQNKKLPGETLIYLPKNTETARTKYKDSTNEQKAIQSERSNFDQWMAFLFNL